MLIGLVCRSAWILSVYLALVRIGSIKQMLGILRLRDTPNTRGDSGGLLGVGIEFEDDLVVFLGVLDAMVD